MILDTHQHFWRADRGDYHWMTPAVPILAQDYLPGDLRPELRRSGVVQTILIQAAQTVDETDFLLMFGSDWPVCLLAASYAEVVNTLRTVVADRLAPGGVTKLFALNGRRFYGID